MPGLVFTAPYAENIETIINPQELIDLYFYGIKITEPDGSEMPTSTLETFIKSAQQEIEKFLNIKIAVQEVKETLDFYRDDWQQWGYIKTTYPVIKPLELTGRIGDVEQVRYPPEWLSSRKTADDDLWFRNIFLVPGHNSPAAGQVVFTGALPMIGLSTNATIPNYWTVRYITGMCSAPMDLINAIGMLAAINVFHIMGDLILGAGIASQSIGIDGLSQSISTTSSATNAGYGARIIGYVETLNGKSVNDTNGLLKRLKNYYKGFTFNVF